MPMFFLPGKFDTCFDLCFFLNILLLSHLFQACFRHHSQTKIFKCPSCGTSSPDVVLLVPNKIPDEIKTLIGNPAKVIEDFRDIVDFHNGHYKGVISAAQRQIKLLQAALSEERNENRRYYFVTLIQLVYNFF